MDLPRILSINESFYPHEGGAEKRSFETLKRLAEKGFEVKVLTNSFDEDHSITGIDVEDIAGIKAQNYFKEGSRKIRGVLKFSYEASKKLLDYNDYDIYNFDEFPLLHALRGNSVLPQTKPSFFTWHEVLQDFYNSRNFLWKRAAIWEKEIAKKLKYHIAVSDTVSNLLKNTYNPANVSIINNGVNTSEFKCNGNKEWGKIVYVGRIEPHKRLDLLVKSFKKHQDLNIKIIGNGSQVNYIKSLINGNKNITITGHLDHEELVKEIKESWLFVMPSYREGFSIASLEAMAASVPVVTVNSRYNLAVNEIIKHGYNGLVTNDFNDLMATVKNLYNDEENWKKLSTNALNFSKAYDWDIISDKLADLYLNVVNNEI